VEYLESYSNRSGDIVSEEGVNADASVPDPIGDTTEAWMVGQRRTGNFTNATGGNRWIMAEDISTNYKTEFELDVGEMNSTTGEFVMNATEDNSFGGLSGSLFDQGWRLTMNISTTDQLTLNLTNVDSAGDLDFSDTDETTVNVGGEETVTVDVLDETVDGSGSDFPTGTSVDTSQADGFRFEKASNGIGTYDFRFDDSATFRNGGRGPCDHPGQSECRGVDSTEKHAVGVVHNITSNAVELDYVSRSTSYSKKIGNMTLDADDVNLNEIEKVDNASYFDVNITGDNSPVAEGSNIQINYEVTNTGTQTDTQNVTLEIPKGDTKDGNDVTLSPSDPPATGTLSWSTTTGDNGTYTAYLISNESLDVDTTQISVDKSSPTRPGIPDGPVGFALPSPVLETLAGVTQR
jgi:hypothetical protein